MSWIASTFSAFASLLSPDGSVRFVQLGLVAVGCVAAYCVFFTVRDALLRSRSLLFHIASLLLVTALPIIGFFVYLLVRPARTVKERETDSMLRELLARNAKEAAAQKMTKPPKPAKEQKAPPAAALFASAPITGNADALSNTLP
jgi:hypothetical protein